MIRGVATCFKSYISIFVYHKIFLIITKKWKAICEHSGRICSVLLKGQQTFSVKSKRENISGIGDHIVSIINSWAPPCEKAGINDRHTNECSCGPIKLYVQKRQWVKCGVKAVVCWPLLCSDQRKSRAIAHTQPQTHVLRANIKTICKQQF